MFKVLYPNVIRILIKLIYRLEWECNVKKSAPERGAGGQTEFGMTG